MQCRCRACPDPQTPWCSRGGCLVGPGLSWKHGQCQRRGSCGELRASLGPSCREHEAGWEVKVGPTPSCVWSQAQSSQGPEGTLLLKGWVRQVCRRWLGMLSAGPPPPPGVAKSSVRASSWCPGHREQTHLSPGQAWPPPPQLSEFLLTAATLDLLPRPPACK